MLIAPAMRIRASVASGRGSELPKLPLNHGSPGARFSLPCCCIGGTPASTLLLQWRPVAGVRVGFARLTTSGRSWWPLGSTRRQGCASRCATALSAMAPVANHTNALPLEAWEHREGQLATG